MHAGGVQLGRTEVKASLPGVGAMVDITETGSSLRANNLRVRAPCFHISLPAPSFHDIVRQKHRYMFGLYAEMM